MIESKQTSEIRLKDENYFEFLNGLWTGKKPPFTRAIVIRNTNFSNDGKIDYSNIAILDVETRQLEKRKLQRNDIIIERSGGGPKQPVGRVVYFDKDSLKTDYSFSNFTSAIRVKDKKRFDSNFIFYFLHNFYLEGKTDQLQRRTTGIRNLDFQSYKELVIFPPLSVNEQKAVVKILTTIQDAIAVQEELIAKLNELKNSTMYHLFTYGARDEKTKLTEFGKIPESWEVTTLGKICKLEYGKSLPKGKRTMGSIPVYGSNGIVGKHNQSVTELPGIIIGRKGSAGLLHFSKTPFYPIDTTFYITEKETNQDITFLFYLLKRLDLRRLKADVGVPGINREMVYREAIAIPKNKDEQIEIAKSLDCIQKKIELANEKLSTYQNLFKTLLHELMSGERKIKL